MTTPDHQDGARGPEPDWEAALRRGQAADGGQGSVEEELAMINLLRHARGPAELAEAELDRVWGQVAAEVLPTPWWRRPWFTFGVPAAAAAAVLLVVLPGGDDTPAGEPALADAGAGMGLILEQQFATLEPAARARVSAAVSDGRDTLRGELLARATAAGDGKSAGGAP